MLSLLVDVKRPPTFLDIKSESQKAFMDVRYKSSVDDECL